MKNWKTFVEEEKAKPYFKGIKAKLQDIGEVYKVYPDRENILRAFKTTEYENTKVVIIGQDPYHTKGCANGLAFAVNEGVTIPPSLRNIFAEVKNEYGREPRDRTLMSWAVQGVFLLNSVLTVNENNPSSHSNVGWQEFTDQAIRFLDSKETPVAFMLWGNFARTKAQLIKNKKHLVLETTHPSPFSCYQGFRGCGHFRIVNDFLKKNKLTEINWVGK
jgi:uracil-DNA glycosylase